MSEQSEYARRSQVAARIARQTGVNVEAVHPQGPIMCRYLVGEDRQGAADAREARAMAEDRSAEDH